MPDVFDNYASERPDATPIIYAARHRTDPTYDGLLKIGYTTKLAEERVSQFDSILTPTGQPSHEVVYSESAMYSDGSGFSDHDVHKVLIKKGFQRQGNSEYFRCSIDDVKAAILAVKTKTTNDENRTESFSMRPEQRAAVDITRAYFEKEKKQNPKQTIKFLWNAKMRFGKTFASYQLAKSMGMKRVLILTFKPAVQSAWEEDLLTHVDFEGWQYYSKKFEEDNGIRPQDLDKDRPIVCFGSFQDFLGVNENGGIKEKNEWVHTENWDLVIFDEYHFGAWRENAKNLFYDEDEDEDEYDTFDIEDYKSEEAYNAINESFLPITSNYYLFLSGTPFRALNTGEFIEDQIFSWTYTDEQYEKSNWKGPDNPYESLPKMIMLTYKMPNEIIEIAKGGEFDEFDLNEFFKADFKKESDLETAQFIHKEYVQKWLNLIRGSYSPTSVDDLKRSQTNKPVMPFSDIRLLNVLNHTFWFLPNVASCYAMRNLLSERQNVFYHDYTINVAAGSKAGIGIKALDPVRASMDPPLETKSITLSCGKLSTGVTVKPWTAIFMLRNLSSPETYFQAAFRVQSPWTIKKDDGTTEILKKECYVFDFALNRALKQIADYSTRLDVKDSNPEKKVGEFIKFLPVLAYDGASMKETDATGILDFIIAGTSATLLARRWESALLVNVDNDTLSRLLANKEALDALMSVEGFKNLNKDIETIINRSDKIKKAKTQDTELSKKEKKELSDEEKENNSKRKDIQKKLIQFATRIPVFMYLTEFREYSLRDVITKLEPGLFKKVTGLTTKDFDILLSLGLFNESLMNESVYKFKRYEDASLEYAGMKKRPENEDIGLFSTILTKEEYDRLANEQGISMGSSFSQTEDKFHDITTEDITEKVTKTKSPVKQRFKTEEIFVKNKAHVDSDQSLLLDVSVGDRVLHNKFGKGTITSKLDTDKIIVTFDEKGEKSMSLKIALGKGFLTLLE